MKWLSKQRLRGFGLQWPRRWKSPKYKRSFLGQKELKPFRFIPFMARALVHWGAILLAIIIGSSGLMALRLVVEIETGLPKILETPPTATSYSVNHSYKYGNDWQIQPQYYTSFGQIPPFLRNLILSMEDKYYYDHNGVDWRSIERAIAINLRTLQFTYGGSTITQQLARNIYLSAEKSLIRKGLEMVAALTMDRVAGKQELLELYLNTVELAPGVFGFGYGAVYHFGTELARLNTDQIIALVSIMPSPLLYGPEQVEERWYLEARRDQARNFYRMYRAARARANARRAEQAND